MLRLLPGFLLAIPLIFYGPLPIPPAQTNSITTIFFDVDGVLFTTSKRQALYHLQGILPLLTYSISNKGLPSHASIFKDLENYSTTRINSLLHPTVESYTHNTKLPNLMLDWQCGHTIVLPEVIAWIHNSQEIAKHKKNLLIATAHTLFTPTALISTRKIIRKGLALARALKDAGYRLIITSNWDHSFELLTAKFPDFFIYNDQPLFDAIYTSADVSGHLEKPLLKPMQGFFEHIVTAEGLRPEECLLIDDESINCQNARDYKMNAVQAQTRHMRRTQKDVVRLLMANSTLALPAAA